MTRATPSFAERERLEVWADPLGAASPQPPALMAALSAEQWGGMVRTAWAVSPRLAIALQVGGPFQRQEPARFLTLFLSLPPVLCCQARVPAAALLATQASPNTLTPPQNFPMLSCSPYPCQARIPSSQSHSH